MGGHVNLSNCWLCSRGGLVLASDRPAAFLCHGKPGGRAPAAFAPASRQTLEADYRFFNLLTFLPQFGQDFRDVHRSLHSEPRWGRRPSFCKRNSEPQISMITSAVIAHFPDDFKSFVLNSEQRRVFLGSGSDRSR